MIFLQLFIVFLQIGIFGFGGGYSMISLIQGQVVTQYHWMTMKEFTDVVAISQMTPGPIGINAATYCGYTAVHNAGMSGMMAAHLLIMNGEHFSTPDNPWHFYISIALFFATFIGVKVMKINPIRMILYSAFAGLLLLY